MAQICSIDDSVYETFKKFKTARKQDNNAIILKVDTKALNVVVEKQFEELPISDLSWELPDASPRYIIYSYKYTHKDGRISYPIVFIYYNPPEINPELCMMYSSSLQQLYSSLQIAKVFFFFFFFFYL